MIKERINALEQIVDLAKRYQISSREITEALESNTSHKYSKTLLYLGSILIAITFLIFISQFLPNMNNTLKLSSIMGSGIIFYCLMIKFSNQEEREFIFQPLAIISPILLTIGTLLSLATIFPDTEENTIILYVSCFMLLQQAATFLYFQTTTSLFFTILFASIFYLTAAITLHITLDISMFILGISYIFISIYLRYTQYNAIIFLGLFFGAISINLSYWAMTSKTIAEYGILILMTAQLYCGLSIKNKTLTFLNLLGIIIYLLYLTTKFFQNSWLWLVTTLILGLLLIISAVKTQRYLNSKSIQR